MFDEQNEQVVFIAKHGGWIAVKKMLIDGHVRGEDISLILSQIQKGINEKSFSYAEIDTAKVEEAAQKYCAGKRRGISSLAEILGSVKTSELKKELGGACKTPAHYPLAEQYFLNRVLEGAGYAAYPDPEILQKIYPGLKVPKPRGNFGKKKKK